MNLFKQLYLLRNLLLVVVSLVLSVSSAQAGLTFIHTDKMGTPQALTNANQTVVWKADIQPYGEAVVNKDPDGNGRLTEMPIRYPGQYHDEDTGLYYNIFRYYDPKLGQYITKDPIGIAGGLNLYAYAGGDPVNYSDPNGLCPVCPFLAPIAWRLTSAALTRVLLANEVGILAAEVGAGVSLGAAGIGAGAKLGGKLAEWSEPYCANPGKVTSPLLEALDQAVKLGEHEVGQVMHVLGDGTKVIFRKDFGVEAHAIGGPFQGLGKIDHYNVEIQRSYGKKIIENIHIVPDGKGSFIWFGKDGVVKP